MSADVPPIQRQCYGQGNQRTKWGANRDVSLRDQGEQEGHGTNHACNAQPAACLGNGGRPAAAGVPDHASKPATKGARPEAECTFRVALANLRPWNRTSRTCPALGGKVSVLSG